MPKIQELKFEVCSSLLERVDHGAGFKEDGITPKRRVQHKRGEIFRFHEDQSAAHIRNLLRLGSIKRAPDNAEISVGEEADDSEFDEWLASDEELGKAPAEEDSAPVKAQGATKKGGGTPPAA